MTTYIIAVYDADRAYGGGEEGGWWYDTGVLARIVKTFKNAEKAYAYCRRLNVRLESRRIGPNVDRKYELGSVCCEGVFQAEVHEDCAPAHYPATRPRYE
jgi:hypothetical protein